MQPSLFPKSTKGIFLLLVWYFKSKWRILTRSRNTQSLTPLTKIKSEKKGAAVIFRKPTRSGLTHPYWQVAPCPDLRWWSNAKGLPCSGQGSMAPRSWKQSNVASICRHPTWVSPTSVLVCLDLWMKLGGIRHHDTRKQVGIHFKRGGVVRMCLDPLNKVRRQTVYQ